MRKFMWSPFRKERSFKGWIVSTVTLLLVLGALTGGLFSFSSRPPTSAHAQSATGGAWFSTGSLHQARARYTATLLFGGKLLVAGGYNSNTGATLASAELYDPSTGTWTATGSLNQARWGHTATRFADGRVLVVGGSPTLDASPTSLASAELYDPATGTWTTTGSLNQARENHTATLMPDARVLITGGVPDTELFEPALASAELYDPATGIWTTTGSLNQARSAHTATRLPDERVLVAGGDNGTLFSSALASAETYNLSTGTWTVTGSLTTAREEHTATLLLNGQVLVAGGEESSHNRMVSAELYDPSTGTWTATVPMNQARSAHTATLLIDGRVLVAGGNIGDGTSLANAEIYDPNFTPPPPPPAPTPRPPTPTPTRTVCHQQPCTSTP